MVPGFGPWSAGSMASRLEARQKYHGRGHGGGKLLPSWRPGSTEGTREPNRKGPGTRHSLQSLTPVTCPIQQDPTGYISISSQQYHQMTDLPMEPPASDVRALGQSQAHFEDCCAGDPAFNPRRLFRAFWIPTITPWKVTRLFHGRPPMFRACH